MNQKKSYVRKLAMVIRQEFDLRVNRHYKSNGIWKIEYIVSAFLEQSSKQFIKTLDDYGELENAFRGFVNINTSFNPRVPPNLKFPCKKLPSLSFDQMLRGVNNHLELAVYDEEQHTTAELSELTVYLADHSYQDLKNLAWWNRRKNHYPFLAKFAQRYLSIAVSSAAIERSFSHAKQVLKVGRSQLLEFKRKELLILKVNSCAKSEI